MSQLLRVPYGYLGATLATVAHRRGDGIGLAVISTAIYTSTKNWALLIPTRRGGGIGASSVIGIIAVI
jgi:hypothetical protein